jgi:hypothetical protein
MKRWTALCLCLFVPSCIIHDDDDGLHDPETTGGRPGPSPECVVAASPGGAGGRGGVLSIRTTSAASILGVVSSNGGEPGVDGVAELGPLLEPASPGEPGLLEILDDPSYLFDDSVVPAGSMVTLGVAETPDTLALGGSEGAPAIVVERFELGNSAMLGLSRVPTIIATTLVIGEGATLLLRDNGMSELTVVQPGGVFETPGSAGGSVSIIARDIVVDGLLDASGGDGESKQAGGQGGHLMIRAETLTVGATGAIVVDGGSGGPGADEQSCQ